MQVTERSTQTVYNTAAVLGILTINLGPIVWRVQTDLVTTLNNPGLPGPFMSLPISFHSARRSWTPLTTVAASWSNVAPVAACKIRDGMAQQRPTHRKADECLQRSSAMASTFWSMPSGSVTPTLLLLPGLFTALLPAQISECPLDLDSQACSFLCWTSSIVVLNSDPGLPLIPPFPQGFPPLIFP